jgi:hypothetical protein
MLRELLRGFEARQPQSVGNMTLIPLVGQETEYPDIGTIGDICLDRDTSYDTLHIANRSGKVAIVPGGYSIVTKETAQDRAVRSKELVAAGTSKQVSAFCVQSTQGGFMQGYDKESKTIRMLPATVKKAAYLNRNKPGFDGLWGTLQAYNTTVGVSGNFLRSFFDKFRQQMDEFIAEFELVPHQRGAIILINDEIIGIEISPNPTAFAAQWELLIRDCYGSEAIARQAQVDKVDETAVFTDAATLEELSAALDDFEDKEFDYVEKLVNSVLSQNESCAERPNQHGQFDGLKVVDIETEDYVGQAVRRNSAVIDLTLLSREANEKGFRFDRSRRR